MERKAFNIALAAALVALATGAQAQRPDGATGLCKDGTYTETTAKKGACAGHKGLKKWYGTRRTPAAAPVDERAPVKPTQSINSSQSGDRLNNTQPTDTSNPTKR
jgi:hypothetical protein